MKLTLKISLTLAVCVGTLSILSFDDGPSGTQTPEQLVASYEYTPPMVKGYYVQKLSNGGGDQPNLRMMIEYWNDPTLPAMPPSLPVYASSEGDPILFYDDGTHGDATAGDRLYTANFRENIAYFRERIRVAETQLATGTVMRFSGHAGEVISSFEPFNFTGFDGGQTVPLSTAIISPSACGSDLLKQNSLFITDLSVVEDPARTYNVVTGTGNPLGAWTFGMLMRNAANYPQTGVLGRPFIRNWLKSWISDQTLNGQFVEKRDQIINLVIQPWLTKCDPNIEANGAITVGNWETKWDASTIQTADLYKNAPFRLMAIVNRLDLVGNHSYARNVSDAGETRFIFTLIDPVTGEPPAALNGPPAQRGTQGASLGGGIDWFGMNVIFEYHNVQTDRCALRNFVQGWLDLSSYPLPTTTTPNTAYNDALEALTNTVTGLNAKPGAPNGSALARIRTNVRILHIGTFNTAADWEHMDWEFRQFEIDPATHLPVQVPLFNTPSHEANSMQFYEGQASGWGGADGQTMSNIGIWASTHTLQLAAGTHVLPVQYLTMASRVNGEWMHYFELDWRANPPSMAYPANFRTLRQQYSLQTCGGCHNGETKTLFTHMLPQGYGKPANYWRPATQGAPDHYTGPVEIHMMPKVNFGVTALPGGGTVENLPLASGTRTIPVVSSFLTGRNYGGLIGAVNAYEDDQIRNIPQPGVLDGNAVLEQNKPDTSIRGFFFVNDPINSWTPSGNGSNNSAIATDKKNGYNDLEDRRNKMCALLQRLCVRIPLSGSQLDQADISVVLQVVDLTNHLPIPDGGH